VTLVVLLAGVLLGSFLVAQGPPNPCANACLETYKAAVKACDRDAACLAAARESLQACVRTCAF
jgi:hypothetical protein